MKCLHDVALRIKKPVSPTTKFNAHQIVPKYNRIHWYEQIKLSNFGLPVSQVLNQCSSGVSVIIQILDCNQTHNKLSSTAEDYFQ